MPIIINPALFRIGTFGVDRIKATKAIMVIDEMYMKPVMSGGTRYCGLKKAMIYRNTDEQPFRIV